MRFSLYYCNLFIAVILICMYLPFSLEGGCEVVCILDMNVYQLYYKNVKIIVFRKNKKSTV
jgi:hypothetical protein